MIALQRDRRPAAVSGGFRPPHLAGKSQELVRMFFASSPPGKLAFGSSQSSKWKKAKEQLKQESAGKCAYCEARTDAVAHGDVEHFRPKSIYWWLAFCYDNYLYSCQICNQSFKSDNFPLAPEGARLTGPAMPNALPGDTAAIAALAALFEINPTQVDDQQLRALWDGEAAEMVNPYTEDPETLFVYESDEVNQEVWVRSAGTSRADRAMQASESFLGLNREELRRDRFPFLRQLLTLRKLIELGLDAEGLEIAEAEVAQKQRSDQSYAGMIRYFARTWNLPGARPQPET